MAKKKVLGTEFSSSSVSSSLSLDKLPGPSGLQSTHTPSSDVQEVMEQCPLMSVPETSATQKQINECFFDEMAENYVLARAPVSSGPRGSLEEWGKSLNGLTQLQKFRELGTLQYGDPAQGPNIVSSIDFDKDEEFFTIGGVTRQLTVYKYHSVVTRSVHYPVQDLTCTGKISCISYNYFIKNLIASCDYDGTVSISDVYIGKYAVQQWREHEKRCWSVHFNHFDSKLVASGSDDFQVKLWAYKVPHSVGTVKAEANICSVRFNPVSCYYIAFGCADHKIYYFDLRFTRQALCVLDSHKKAVSYCQFLNNRELVSLSTDSEIKLWDINTGECLKTYHGHRNDKNFVGLAVKGSHIVCGSEDNLLYCYYKDVSRNIITHQFNEPRSRLPGIVQSPDNPFVSAVCWKPKSSVLLAANSLGYMKVLEAVT